MRTLLAILALVVVAIGLAAFASHMHPGGELPPAEQEDTTAQQQQQQQQKQQQQQAAKNDPDRLHKLDKYKAGAVHATMVIENRGTLELEIYPKAAPKTVAHFVDLCKQHFYDGVLFHRVHPGFVAQAGDPKSKTVDGAKIADLDDNAVSSQYGLGSGGSGHSVPLEANLPHLPNTIGLARSQDPNSGDSQFYINLADNASLDGQYCVFGQVVKGTDILPNIKQGDRIKSLTVP